VFTVQQLEYLTKPQSKFEFDHNPSVNLPDFGLQKKTLESVGFEFELRHMSNPDNRQNLTISSVPMHCLSIKYCYKWRVVFT